MPVPVILMADGGNDESRRELRAIFASPTFHVIETKDSGCEVKAVRKALDDAFLISANEKCIIIRDTSTTYYEFDDIERIARYDMSGCDALYLGRWGDGCNLYRNQEEYVGVKVVSTYRPGGFQAIMLSVSARDAIRTTTYTPGQSLNKLISSMVYSGNFRAKTVTVNLFVFDIIRFARSNSDYEKRNECLPVVPSAAPNIKAYTYFFVAALIILVVLLGVGLYYIIPHSTTPSAPSSQPEEMGARDIISPRAPFDSKFK